MQIMSLVEGEVVGGVDTHQDQHVAAVVDHRGATLATQQFPATRHGYCELISWMSGYGSLKRVGVECTGSYGAGLARTFADRAVAVYEVTAPDKGLRRAKGKDDFVDAIAAARSAYSGQRLQVAKDRRGRVEALRVLRTTRKTAVKCRRAALQQMHNTIVAAPDEVREQFGSMTRMQLIRAGASSRPDPQRFRDPVVATRLSLKEVRVIR
jgi:transposase